MAKIENRSQLMDYFGAKQKNFVWSWCGINEEEKKIYFSVWTDYKNKFDSKGTNYYTIQEPHWGITDSGGFSAARNDHDINLGKVFNEGYQAFGYFIKARKVDVVPREIEKTITSFVFSLELERLNTGEIIGYPNSRIEVN